MRTATEAQLKLQLRCHFQLQLQLHIQLHIQLQLHLSIPTHQPPYPACGALWICSFTRKHKQHCIRNHIPTFVLHHAHTITMATGQHDTVNGSPIAQDASLCIHLPTYTPQCMHVQIHLQDVKWRLLSLGDSVSSANCLKRWWTWKNNVEWTLQQNAIKRGYSKTHRKHK